MLFLKHKVPVDVNVEFSFKDAVLSLEKTNVVLVLLYPYFVITFIVAIRNEVKTYL